MASEKSLVLIKPDAMKRGLHGLVLNKLEEAKLSLIGAKLVKVSETLAKDHYAQHEGKKFFPELIDYITGKLHGAPGDRVFAFVYEGENAIKTIRALAGATNPENAEPNTLRGQFGRVTTKGTFENVVHASATPLEAEREIKLWFAPGDVVADIYPTKQNGSGRVWDRIPAVSELEA